MFSFIQKYWSRGKPVPDPDPTWSPADRRIFRPSEEDFEAQRLRSESPDHYVSDSFTDPSCRGGPLGTENEMPDGGDSTRGMSKGPASKSPLPIRGICEPLCPFCPFCEDELHEQPSQEAG